MIWEKERERRKKPREWFSDHSRKCKHVVIFNYTFKKSVVIKGMYNDIHGYYASEKMVQM